MSYIDDADIIFALPSQIPLQSISSHDLIMCSEVRNRGAFRFHFSKGVTVGAMCTKWEDVLGILAGGLHCNAEEIVLSRKVIARSVGHIVR